MRVKKLALLVASLFLATAWGCGSNMESDGISTVDPGGIEAAQTVGITNCATCHNQGTGVTSDWLASRHANSNINPNNTNATCMACHDAIGDGQLISTAFAGEPNRMVVGCESCHGGGQYHWGLGQIPFPVPGPARCTQCHGIEQALFHGTAPERIINDTHFDDPDTPEIEGYVVDVNDERGCLKCHFNAHNPTLEINTAWARSGHAGQILTVKEAEGVGGQVTDDTGPAWAHYDFKAENRASCQRCHTSTGAANFLDDPSGYDPAQNVFAATGQQKEMLYCWGCHADQTGALRNPGSLALAGQTFPNASSSNVCIACHSGRESGNSITNSTADFSNTGFINSHYLAAGGTLYGTIGYHYAGRVYDTVNLHAGIGTSNSIGAAIGDNGACVKCHMSPDSNENPGHTFEVVTHSGGQITAINPDFCTSCHVGSLSFVAADMNIMKDDFHGALEALKAQLAANGIFFANAHPYFFKSADNTTSANAFRAWGNKETMGAAFNFNLLEHEPGGYAHNPRYAQRLIWDSIDWLDDGLLNNSTVAAVNALPIDQATKNAALAFLGTSRP